jgi:hypothetical protein
VFTGEYLPTIDKILTVEEIFQQLKAELAAIN